ncbi:hypothetical protein MUK42_19162 [Musa troglodytarum]|uniref:Uncharacterized protein n=1 Tax=Musa troglodytarum TaxID=320322 RepID=A0A9E7G9Z1_9LILI|nr:hypothetical protein MUK42_19162 [Musa troglodytarum]URE08169.1 hypothetical protein MUK42_19162 [Musa troglodytarum]URE08170.1 hypothetical protein MUK42_19162 [Musa troglodytarum]
MFPRPGMSRKVVRIILKLPRWECLLIVNAPVQKTKDLVKLTCRREPSSYPQSWRGIKIITDEKATNLPLPLSVSADHVTKLEVCARKLPRGFGVNPIQLERIHAFPAEDEAAVAVTSCHQRLYQLSSVGMGILVAVE